MKLVVLSFTAAVVLCLVVWAAPDPLSKPEVTATTSVKTDAHSLHRAAAPGATDPAPRTSATLDEGGEDCGHATVLPGIPSMVSGNTCGFSDNLNAICPYPETGGKDVVYQYSPQQDMQVDLTLCSGSTNYDTKLYVFDGSCTGTPIACNDDQCSNPPLFNSPWISRLLCVEFLTDHTYYIVVDGYSAADCGDYTLTVSIGECAPPCNTPPPNDDCASVTPVALPATFTGNRDCATPDCPLFGSVGQGNVWIAFYTTEAGAVTLDYCGSPITGNSWVVMSPECPCQTATYSAGWWSEICPDNITNTTCRWDYLPAGTYYYPVLRNDATGAVGPYTINVNFTRVNPVARCCYGPENLLCANVLSAECQTLGGTWAPGLTCELYPCGVPFECQGSNPLDGRHCNLVGGPIPDYPAPNGSFPIEVPVEYHITDVNVSLDISHTWDGDLALHLMSPSGTLTLLSFRRGGAGDNFQCTTFDDEAALPLRLGSAPFQGSFIPDGDLSAFDGENALGEWSLWYWDGAAGNVGTLNWVCLTFQYDEILPVELSSFTAIPGEGKVTLNWATASETGNDRFEILRDGIKAHEVPATNSPTGASYAWTDLRLENGTFYSYTLVSVATDGSRDYLGVLSTAPSADAAVITETALHQNYPNPFNATTTFVFDLVESGFTTLELYNIAGQKVATAANSNFNAGRHTITFDASGLSSGMYICRLEVNGFTAQKKVLLMK